MKFGVREICDVTFKSTADTVIGSTTFLKGQPVIYIDTAKTSNLEGAATTVYAQGGKGNSRLLAWEGEKTLTFTVEDAMLSPLGFSVLSGAGVVDAGAGADAIKVHTVVETEAALVASNFGTTMGTTGTLDEVGVKIDLDALGLAATDTAKVYVNAKAPMFGVEIDSQGGAVANLGKATLYNQTGAKVVGDFEITSTTYLVADFAVAPSKAAARVRLDFYLVKEANVQELQITAEKFAGYYYVEAQTLFRDQATGEDFPAEIIMPKVKIQSNFTFAMASTGDPSTFSFVMDAFPGTTPFSTKKVMCLIQMDTETLTVG
jgi:hypothetical protein